MDLLLKVGILIIVLIVIFGAAFLIFVHTGQSGPLTQAQAQQIVLNDIKASNPNATVTVVSSSPSPSFNNSWSIVLAIVYNATRPCPTLFIEGFDYPATGLSISHGIDNLYTTKCVISGLSTAPTYVISSPEIAIARSYNTSSPELVNYVTLYGYNNVNVYATFYANLGASATPLGQSFSNIWLVNYTAKNAPYSQYVVLAQSGQIIGNYTYAH
jgi:hypothetical protein